MSKKITAVMYHYVRDLRHSRYPDIKGLDTELFREQIHYLKKNYNFVKIEEVIEAYKGNYVLPDNPVILTFDDAYSDHFTNVFPILEKEHIQGCFYPPVRAITEHIVLDVNKIHFILASTPSNQFDKLLEEIKLMLNIYREEYGLNTYDYYFEKLAKANRFDNKETIFVKRLLQSELELTIRKKMVDELFVKIVGVDESSFSRELYMSIDQIRCMIDCGMHVGSHGFDHFWLGTLPKDKQELEIKQSVSFIKEIGADINNWSICYPYGNYNEDTIELLKKYNCSLGLTTIVGKANPDNSDIDAVYKLPRLDTNDLPKDSNAINDNWKDK